LVQKGIDRMGLEFNGFFNKLAAKHIILNEYDAKRDTDISRNSGHSFFPEFLFQAIGMAGVSFV
jgi:hypothetical protein